MIPKSNPDSMIYKDSPNLAKAIERLESKIRATPNNGRLISNLLKLLDCQTPNITGTSSYSECQRALGAHCESINFNESKLSIEKLKCAYPSWDSIIQKFEIDRSVPIAQIYQGKHLSINNVYSECSSFLNLFKKTGVIADYCDDCFKVQILPETVLSLIQLYFVLGRTTFKRDNQRKCMLELREKVPYPYKGYIFCETESEAKACLELIKREMEKIGVSNICYGISHGCSEYGLKYPNFKYKEDGSFRSFQKPSQWKETETSFLSNNPKIGNSIYDQTNKQITLLDMICFETWIEFANLIGDHSYKEIRAGVHNKKTKQFIELISEQAPLRLTELAALRVRMHS